MKEHQIRTYDEWEAMPEAMRSEWLAYDFRRRDGMERIMDSFNQRIKADKPIEFAPFIAVLMEMLT